MGSLLLLIPPPYLSAGGCYGDVVLDVELSWAGRRAPFCCAVGLAGPGGGWAPSWREAHACACHWPPTWPSHTCRGRGHQPPAVPLRLLLPNLPLPSLSLLYLALSMNLLCPLLCLFLHPSPSPFSNQCVCVLCVYIISVCYGTSKKLWEQGSFSLWHGQTRVLVLDHNKRVSAWSRAHW